MLSPAPRSFPLWFLKSIPFHKRKENLKSTPRYGPLHICADGEWSYRPYWERATQPTHSNLTGFLFICLGAAEQAKKNRKIIFSDLNRGVSILQSCFLGPLNRFWDYVALHWPPEIAGIRWGYILCQGIIDSEVQPDFSPFPLFQHPLCNRIIFHVKL